MEDSWVRSGTWPHVLFLLIVSIYASTTFLLHASSASRLCCTHPAVASVLPGLAAAAVRSRDPSACLSGLVLAAAAGNRHSTAPAHTGRVVEVGGPAGVVLSAHSCHYIHPAAHFPSRPAAGRNSRHPIARSLDHSHSHNRHTAGRIAGCTAVAADFCSLPAAARAAGLLDCNTVVVAVAGNYRTAAGTPWRRGTRLSKSHSRAIITRLATC